MSKGTPWRKIRVSDQLWAAFAAVCAEQDSDCSTELRRYMAWKLRTPGVTLPKRPEVSS